MVDRFVYPPRNLPGLAEDWGRASETHANLLSKELVQQSQTMNNALRATGGQLAVIAQQVDLLGSAVNDLSSRAALSTAPASLQLILGPTAGEVGPVSRSVSLPPPPDGVGRSAIVVAGGSVAWTGTNTGGGISDSATTGIEFRQDSVRRWYNSVVVSSAQFFSFIGSPTFNLVAPVQVPGPGSTFDLRLWVGGSSSGGQPNRGARLENMFFTIIYGNKL